MQDLMHRTTYVVREDKYSPNRVWVIHENKNGSFRYYWNKGKSEYKSTTDKAELFGAIVSGMQIRWESIQGGPASAIVAAKQVEVVLDGVNVTGMYPLQKDAVEPSTEELIKRGHEILAQIESIKQNSSDPRNRPTAGERLKQLAE